MTNLNKSLNSNPVSGFDAIAVKRNKVCFKLNSIPCDFKDMSMLFF